MLRKISESTIRSGGMWICFIALSLVSFQNCGTANFAENDQTAAAPSQSAGGGQGGYDGKIYDFVDGAAPCQTGIAAKSRIISYAQLNVFFLVRDNCQDFSPGLDVTSSVSKVTADSLTYAS